MNSGRTLQELAVEIDRQRKSKKDFLASTRELTVYTPDRGEYGVGETTMDLQHQGDYPINSFAHSQIALHLGIPKPYYDRLRGEVPTLFDNNVNTLLRLTPDKDGRPQKRFVRTLDGRVRGFLADNYLPIDTAPMTDRLFSELSTYPGLQVDSSDITETRFYLKVSTPRIAGDVKLNDPVQMGVLIQNSEVGRGRWKAWPFVKRLVCTNGMIFEDFGVARTHRGARLGGPGDMEPEDIYEYMSDEALKAAYEAFFLRVRDAVRAIMGETVFNRLLEHMNRAITVKIENPEAAISEVARWGDLTEAETGGVMRHLIEGGDLSMWGMANAITAAADSVHPKGGDYDRNTDMQLLGGKLITLRPDEYRVITEATKVTERRRKASERSLQNALLGVY